MKVLNKANAHYFLLEIPEKNWINQTKTKISPEHDSFLHSFGLPLFLEGKNILAFIQSFLLTITDKILRMAYNQLRMLTL